MKKWSFAVASLQIKIKLNDASVANTLNRKFH